MVEKKNILIFFIIIGIVAIILSLAFCLKIILFRPREAPVEIAIVIDDWGYNLRYLNLLKEIKAPVTVSILPNLRYSSQIAREARGLGREIILHLPLEPELDERAYLGLEENTIAARMSEKEIIADLQRALASVPEAAGVSNHMGSKATKDANLMAIIFRQLKKKRLFFLDNRVTGESICAPLARKMRIKFAQRDFFLDNKNDAAYIREQFKKLAQFARESKSGIGIAHARPTTLKVLKEEINLLQAEGIKFVPISNLVR